MHGRGLHSSLHVVDSIIENSSYEHAIMNTVYWYGGAQPEGVPIEVTFENTTFKNNIVTRHQSTNGFKDDIMPRFFATLFTGLKFRKSRLSNNTSPHAKTYLAILNGNLIMEDALFEKHNNKIATNANPSACIGAQMFVVESGPPDNVGFVTNITISSNECMDVRFHESPRSNEYSDA